MSVEELPIWRGPSVFQSEQINRPYDWTVDDIEPYTSKPVGVEPVGIYIDGFDLADEFTTMLPIQNLEKQMRAEDLQYIDGKIRESFFLASVAAYGTSYMTFLEVLDPHKPVTVLEVGIVAVGAGLGHGLAKLSRYFARQQR